MVLDQILAVNKNLFTMNLIEFMDHYPDEQSCKQAFRAYREQEGVICKKCGCANHYWKKDKQSYQCKKCSFRTTLRSGTVMQSSKLPFQYWFIAMHLMSSTKKSFSAKDVQRQLGHKRYQPIWEMMHKLRAVMGLRDNGYLLESHVELDEGFFSTATKKAVTKRGRGSEKKTCVMVMAESEEVKSVKKGRPIKRCGHFKMKVMKNMRSETVNSKVENCVSNNAIACTDGYRSYTDLKEVVSQHHPLVVPPKEAGKLLPWVHIAIANVKRLLLNTHHRIDGDFLENYLNEFCFKLNRRYFNNLIDRLLVAAVSYRWNYLG